jgi:hypothetical protein
VGLGKSRDSAMEADFGFTPNVIAGTRDRSALCGLPK